MIFACPWAIGQEITKLSKTLSITGRSCGSTQIGNGENERIYYIEIDISSKSTDALLFKLKYSEYMISHD